MQATLFLISLIASAIGAICGIGGGVIIKPVLDSVTTLSVSTVSFLSGCTVLAMSSYSVVQNKLGGKGEQNSPQTLPLALGAAIGGVGGKQLFQALTKLFENAEAVGTVQAACLAAITTGTLLYTLCQARISTHTVRQTLPSLLIGLALGLVSSFLGIGGGPINLMVLSFFFSMGTKEAARNSLFVILCSQCASLILTLVTRTVPPFEPLMLVWMVLGGLGGGIAGRKLNRRMNEKAVRILFCSAMVVIIGLCVSRVIAGA